MSIKGKKVLITGAGGFIGSALAERLVQEGAHCRAFVHYNALGKRGWLDHSNLVSEMEVVAGDISDTDSVEQAVKGCEYVLHLAALIPIPYSYRAPRSYLRVNVEGTLNVLQACRAHEVKRMVHTSTSEVYGTAQFVPITEEHPLSAQSPYAASKVGADQMVMSFVRSFELPALILRPFNTFGPRQSVRAVIPAIILQALKGNIVQLGKVSSLRDFNYVQNTVDAYLAACEANSPVLGEPINLGSNSEISVEGVVQLVGRIVGKRLEIECEEQRLRPGRSEVDRLLADASKAERCISWKPKLSFAEGLLETVNWFRENHRLYSSETFAV